MSEEIWKWIPGYENWYEVSTEGRIRSYVNRGAKPVNKLSKTPLRILTPIFARDRKYFNVSLSHESKPPIHDLIHLIVLKTFVGPRPKGKEGAHNDGVKTNNNLENLRWATPSENQMDRLLHGTDNRGSRHGLSKLNEKQVRGIRDKYKTGEYTQRKLAKEYSISQQHCSQLITKVRWDWLD